MRPALPAGARDLLLQASTLTEIADECRRKPDLAEEEAQLADRVIVGPRSAPSGSRRESPRPVLVNSRPRS